MALDPAPFIQLVGEILQRHARQNEGDLPLSAGRALGERLWDVVVARGLPPPLPAGETGAPSELSAGEVAPLVEEVLGPLSHHAQLLEPVRQLVKACFHREFANCRESYREIGSDGSCRRQQLAKARARVSGTHCVDCPYWTALSAKAHAALLRAAWCGEPAAFEAERAVFLPEDFRALRNWLRRAAPSNPDADVRPQSESSGA